MRTYSEDDIKEAIEEVNNGSTIAQVAMAFGIPRSTLAGRIQGGRRSRSEAFESLQLLPKDVESDLSGWIFTEFRIGNNPTRAQIRKIGEHLAGQDRSIGVHWLDNFFQRNPEVKELLNKKADERRKNRRAPKPSIWALQKNRGNSAITKINGICTYLRAMKSKAANPEDELRLENLIAYVKGHNYKTDDFEDKLRINTLLMSVKAGLPKSTADPEDFMRRFLDNEDRWMLTSHGSVRNEWESEDEDEYEDAVEVEVGRGDEDEDEDADEDDDEDDNDDESEADDED